MTFYVIKNDYRSTDAAIQYLAAAEYGGRFTPRIEFARTFERPEDAMDAAAEVRGVAIGSRIVMKLLRDAVIDGRWGLNLDEALRP